MRDEAHVFGGLRDKHQLIKYVQRGAPPDTRLESAVREAWGGVEGLVQLRQAAIRYFKSRLGVVRRTGTLTLVVERDGAVAPLNASSVSEIQNLMTYEGLDKVDLLRSELQADVTFGESRAMRQVVSAVAVLSVALVDPFAQVEYSLERHEAREGPDGTVTVMRNVLITGADGECSLASVVVVFTQGQVRDIRKYNRGPRGRMK
jgi:hypothetical protein